MTHQHKSIILAAALALGLALPACSLPEGVTFADLDLAQSKVTVAKTEDAAEDEGAVEATEDEAADEAEEGAEDETASGKAAGKASKGGKAAAADADDEETETDADFVEGHTITVSGNVDVKVEPDKASFGISVTTEAKTAKKAQSDNADAVNDVIAALKEAGVAEKSIQTSDAWLSPQWDYDSDDEERITGYEMTTRLEVSDLAVDEVGTIMAKAVESGANGIDGPSYYSSTYAETYADALAQAVEATKPKAETIAKAADVTLGRVVSVTEGYQDMTYAYAKNAVFEELATADSGSIPDIQPGEISVSAQVTVVYAIK